MNFQRKPHTFDQPGEPRSGRGRTCGSSATSSACRRSTRRHARGDVVGRGLRGRAGPAVPARAVPPRDDRAAGRDPRRGLPRRRPHRAARLLHGATSGRGCSRPSLPRLRDRADARTATAINAWIAHVRSNPSDLPGEFPALGVQLTDWTQDDSVAVGIFLARTVPSGSGVELQNLRTLRAIGPAGVRRAAAAAHAGRRAVDPAARRAVPVEPRAGAVKQARRGVRADARGLARVGAAVARARGRGARRTSPRG